MTDKILEQILIIRDSGMTNMFDMNMVQSLAFDQGFYELVIYIYEHPKEYFHFIMCGTEE